MKCNRFGYYVKEGITSIFTHGFMSFASVCVILACLLIMGCFSLVALNVNKLIGDAEAQNEVLAFVDESFSDVDAMALQSQLEAVPNVADVMFVHRDQAMDDFDDQVSTAMLEGLDSSILRHRFVVHLDDIGQMGETRDALRAVYGIAEVRAHLKLADNFVMVRNVVGIISIALVAILLIISLFIMTNTIKLATFERREEIAIMKMVGATNGFIRWPFVVEGMLLGITGALLAYIAQWGLYILLLSRIQIATMFFSLISFAAVAVPLLVAFLAVGLFVGVLGSLFAIRNYLRV